VLGLHLVAAQGQRLLVRLPRLDLLAKVGEQGTA
jgi:hypothetical protein